MSVDALSGQKRVLDTRELKSQVVMSCPTGLLGKSSIQPLTSQWSPQLQLFLLPASVSTLAIMQSIVLEGPYLGKAGWK